MKYSNVCEVCMGKSHVSFVASRSHTTVSAAKMASELLDFNPSEEKPIMQPKIKEWLEKRKVCNQSSSIHDRL